MQWQQYKRPTIENFMIAAANHHRCFREGGFCDGLCDQVARLVVPRSQRHLRGHAPLATKAEKREV